MLFVICGQNHLDDEQLLKVFYWIEEHLSRGGKVEFGFESAAALELVRNIHPESAQLTYTHSARCASSDDWGLYAAIRGLGIPGHVQSLQRFDGRNFVELCSVQAEVGVLGELLTRLLAELDGANLDRIDALVDAFRELLLARRGTYAADVFGRVQQSKVLVDTFRSRHLAALDGSVSSLVYSRKRTIESWADLFVSIDPTAPLTALSSWGHIAGDLVRISAFHRDGRAALAADQADMRAGRSPKLATMLWLAAYFVRVSEQYLAIGDSSAAIATTVRVLETYVDFRLYELGVLEVDYATQELESSGVGQVRFSAVRATHGTGLKASVAVLVARAPFDSIATAGVEQVIQLRNRCTMAHGVQRIPVSAARDGLVEVKRFVTDAERATPLVGDRWKNVLRDSFVLDWKGLGGSLFNDLV
ncbi:MAG: hypothetical protein RIQ60_2043 [Pseudomonadota bacterium]|jgi:hypothetical protein